MAANYLQTLDWHQHPDLAQSIVTFYNKVLLTFLPIVGRDSTGLFLQADLFFLLPVNCQQIFSMPQLFFSMPQLL